MFLHQSIERNLRGQDIVCALQVSLRRGRVEEALYWADVLHRNKFWNCAFTRLKKFVMEDAAVNLLLADFVQAEYQKVTQVLGNRKRSTASNMPLAKAALQQAVTAVCAAPKSRVLFHLVGMTRKTLYHAIYVDPFECTTRLRQAVEKDKDPFRALEWYMRLYLLKCDHTAWQVLADAFPTHHELMQSFRRQDPCLAAAYLLARVFPHRFSVKFTATPIQECKEIAAMPTGDLDVPDYANPAPVLRGRDEDGRVFTQFFDEFTHLENEGFADPFAQDLASWYTHLEKTYIPCRPYKIEAAITSRWQAERHQAKQAASVPPPEPCVSKRPREEMQEDYDSDGSQEDDVRHHNHERRPEPSFSVAGLDVALDAAQPMEEEVESVESETLENKTMQSSSLPFSIAPASGPVTILVGIGKKSKRSTFRAPAVEHFQAFISPFDCLQPNTIRYTHIPRGHRCAVVGVNQEGDALFIKGPEKRPRVHTQIWLNNLKPKFGLSSVTMHAVSFETKSYVVARSLCDTRRPAITQTWCDVEIPVLGPLADAYSMTFSEYINDVYHDRALDGVPDQVVDEYLKILMFRRIFGVVDTNHRNILVVQFPGDEKIRLYSFDEMECWTNPQLMGRWVNQVSAAWTLSVNMQLEKRRPLLHKCLTEWYPHVHPDFLPRFEQVAAELAFLSVSK